VVVRLRPRLGEVYRPIPLAASTIGDLALGPIPVVNWSIQFLYVHPKEAESPLFRLPVLCFPPSASKVRLRLCRIGSFARPDPGCAFGPT
jgi:hypothetical protein